MYVTDTPALDDVCARMRAVGVVGLDTEFMRERTYFAQLCLVQLATVDEVAVVDPLAPGLDLASLDALLADRSVLKVLHAGIQDLEILHQRTGSAPGPVFDTQVAATLAGFANQVGYAALVQGLLGVTVGKGERFTDWARRPLDAKQLAYAEEDARHLPVLYAELRARLERDGRLEWLRAEFERLADPATYEVDPYEQYRRVKRASSLNRRHLGVLRDVTAWRETEARSRDIPRRRVLPDEVLVEIARRVPGDERALEAVRGVRGRLSRSAAGGLLEAVAKGAALPDAELPRIERGTRREAPEGVVELMAAFVRIRARHEGVAAPLLASRHELEALACGDREGSPLLQGWRRELVGRDLVSLLEGRVSLHVGPSGVEAVEEPGAGNEETARAD